MRARVGCRTRKTRRVEFQRSQRKSGKGSPEEAQGLAAVPAVVARVDRILYVVLG